MFYNKSMVFKYIFPELYYAHKVSEASVWSRRYSDHFHTGYEMLYFISGDVEFFIEDKRYKLEPGDLVVVRPGSHHNSHALSSAKYERYVVGFTQYLIPSDLIAMMEGMEGCFHVGETCIPALFARFDEHVANVGDDRETLKMLFRCVLSEIIVYFCRFGGKEGAYAPVLKENMAAVLNYINKNIETPFSLEEICRTFHYSKSYLCREFSTSMGVPLMSYVRTKKIMYADALLRSGMKPTELYVWCGFSDYSTFYRMYKKIMGKSPSERLEELSAIKSDSPKPR